MVSSVEAAAGLIDDRIMAIWTKLREAIIIYLSFQEFNEQRRERARDLLREAAILAERVFNLQKTLYYFKLGENLQ